MRSFILLGLVAAAGCVHSDRSTVPERQEFAPGWVHVEGGLTYLVDPASETCVLYEAGTAVAVDCAALKRNLPEAARLITWLDDKPAPKRTTPKAEPKGDTPKAEKQDESAPPVRRPDADYN